jgi:hypothetical protein
MTKEFEDWLLNKRNISVAVSINDMQWEMQWGVYQMYFWETKKWWVSIYPYTDKFGGKIEGFHGESIYKCDFITNSPNDAQKKIILEAFEIFDV